jgi:hypothetical protein
LKKTLAAVSSLLLAGTLSVSPAYAVLIVGGNLGGGDLTPANGDILSGTFTNVGTFSIPLGATVFVAGGVPLSVTASAINIDGILNGVGAGFAGGPSVNNISPNCQGSGTPSGIAGSGPGGGGGGLFGNCVHGDGGGGGAYGGAGGQSGSFFGSAPPPTLGGSSYDPNAGTVEMGSGGGSGSAFGDGAPASGFSGAGGAGGGSISLFAGTIMLDGFILVDGADGLAGVSASGGGGGSGGGILLSGTMFLDGPLSASGGDGAGGSGAGLPIGGGGGGGGRIKLLGLADFLPGFSVNLSGGAAGPTQFLSGGTQATAGGDGVLLNQTEPVPVPEPSTLLLLASVLIGLIGPRLGPRA